MTPTKRHLSLFVFALLVGCASDPAVTGKPQDWMGHPASDLRASQGEPTKIVHQSNGDEVWEYVNSRGYIVPKGESMSAGLGGGVGGFSMEKRPEDRPAEEINLSRFKIRNGKVVEWYASRSVNGRVVWQDH